MSLLGRRPGATRPRRGGPRDEHPWWDPEDQARAAWAVEGPESLAETWRRRWLERDVEPGWIEVTRRADIEIDPRIDWLRIEDHTDLADPTDVAVYQHLTLWAGRGVAVVTLRHLLDTPVDAAGRWFGETVLARLAGAFDRDGAGPGHP